MCDKKAKLNKFVGSYVTIKLKSGAEYTGTINSFGENGDSDKSVSLKDITTPDGIKLPQLSVNAQQILSILVTDNNEVAKRKEPFAEPKNFDSATFTGFGQKPYRGRHMNSNRGNYSLGNRQNMPHNSFRTYGHKHEKNAGDISAFEMDKNTIEEFKKNTNDIKVLAKEKTETDAELMEKWDNQNSSAALIVKSAGKFSGLSMYDSISCEESDKMYGIRYSSNPKYKGSQGNQFSKQNDAKPRRDIFEEIRLKKLAKNNKKPVAHKDDDDSDDENVLYNA